MDNEKLNYKKKAIISQIVLLLKIPNQILKYKQFAVFLTNNNKAKAKTELENNNNNNNNGNMSFKKKSKNKEIQSISIPTAKPNV